MQTEGVEARSVDEAIAVLRYLITNLTYHFDLPWFGYIFMALVIWSLPYVDSLKEPEVDRHPEKRMKAAFTAYEEANMPRIKAENPTLRMSQLKQILRKEWMRSPENPLNQ